MTMIIMAAALSILSHPLAGIPKEEYTVSPAELQAFRIELMISDTESSSDRTVEMRTEVLGSLLLIAEKQGKMQGSLNAPILLKIKLDPKHPKSVLVENALPQAIEAGKIYGGTPSHDTLWVLARYAAEGYWSYADVVEKGVSYFKITPTPKLPAFVAYCNQFFMAQIASR